jgi:glycosyltransferase involved in cell wall biosynthesis
MRILYVLTSLGMGGAEKLALALCEQMTQRGHEVSLLVLMSRLNEEWQASFPRLHLDIRRSPVSLARGIARARRFTAEFEPDLIHSHSFHANLLARLLKLRAPRPVVISTIHNVYEGGTPRMLAYRLTDRLSRRTVAVSKAAAQRFVRLKAVPAKKCSVIANGIDVSQFLPNEDRRASMRALMAIDAGPQASFVWLAAGRIARAKDYPNLLRAFCMVRAVHSDAQLWVAGTGRSTELGLLQSLAEHLSLNGCVHWLGLRRDMPAVLDAADGFVSSSAWEGMPLAVGEAMAMGKQVVVTDVGGVRELVGDAGVIVPSRCADQLASAMLSAMRRSSGDRLAFGRAARDRVVGEFGMDANADQWEALYREFARKLPVVHN